MKRNHHESKVRVRCPSCNRYLSQGWAGAAPGGFRSAKLHIPFKHGRCPGGTLVLKVYAPDEENEEA